MAVLRLNDGKHFLPSVNEQKKEKIFGQVNEEGKLIIH